MKYTAYCKHYKVLSALCSAQSLLCTLYRVPCLSVNMYTYPCLPCTCVCVSIWVRVSFRVRVSLLVGVSVSVCVRQTQKKYFQGEEKYSLQIYIQHQAIHKSQLFIHIHEFFHSISASIYFQTGPAPPPSPSVACLPASTQPSTPPSTCLWKTFLTFDIRASKKS